MPVQPTNTNLSRRTQSSTGINPIQPNETEDFISHLTSGPCLASGAWIYSFFATFHLASLGLAGSSSFHVGLWLTTKDRGMGVTNSFFLPVAPDDEGITGVGCSFFAPVAPDDEGITGVDDVGFFFRFVAPDDEGITGVD